MREIYRCLPPSEIRKRYGTLHEASEERCADAVDRLIEERTRKRETLRLQTLRKAAGLSQRGLAEKSGVNIRTLQQYEIGAKEIRKASVETVIALARAIGCRPEDICS